MHGAKKKFTVQGVTLTLARASISEFAEIEQSLLDIIGEPDKSGYQGEMYSILAKAVENETDADKAAFEKLLDAVYFTELWEQWEAFSEAKKLLIERSRTKLEFITKERTKQFQTAGFTAEEAQELVQAAMR